MPANVSGIMAGLATRVDTITGLRVYAYPADAVSVPAAVIAFPDEVTYDDTMARGADRVTIPVHVLVGKVSDRASAAKLNAYLAGSGASSIKAAIEADKTLSGAADTTRVTEATVTGVTVGGVELLSATFLVEVIG